MHIQTISRRLIGACAVFTAVLLAGPAVALQLITESEAALPPDQNHVRDRGILRGPTVVIVSPPPAAGVMKSPLNLKIRFEGHGGARIDVDSVLLTYMKQPEIDLTQRLRPFIAATGIDVLDAEVPPGTHMIRVNVTDTDGHSSSTDFTFSVSK